MLKSIIEIIDTKNSWGKNQLLKTLEPEINKQAYKCLSGLDTVKHAITNMAVFRFIDYINSKASHGKVELKLALLNCIANEESKE